MRKILVLRGGALGDFIVTLPALELLRRRWPDARIELAGNATAAQLARRRGLIDAAYSQHEARWGGLFADGPLAPDFASWLGEFDLVLSFWPDPDGSLRRRFPLRARQQFLSAPALPAGGPAAAHYCAPLRALGLEMREPWCRLRPLPESPPSPATIVVHPGSGSPRKNWPRENWLALLAQLPAPMTLVLGEAEDAAFTVPGVNVHPAPPARSSAHATAADEEPRVTRLVNRPLEELVATFAASRLFLGHDSGVSHLAAACGAKCLLLFGPTDPAVWAPPAPGVRWLRGGRDLRSIPVEDVRRAAEAMLADRT